MAGRRLIPALVVVALSLFGLIGHAEFEQLTHGRSPIWLNGLIGITVLLVLPSIAATGAWQWMNSSLRRRVYVWGGRLNPEHRTQTSWDFAFNHEQDLLLVVELKDGSRVAGYYGRRSHWLWNSYARSLSRGEMGRVVG